MTGGWLSSLGEALVATGEVELLVVSFVRGNSDKSVRVDGCDHELIAIEPKRFGEEAWSYPSLPLRQKCSDIVERFQADLVHVNGTEYGYGLLVSEGDIEVPAVISIQGVLRAISRNFFADMSFADRLRSCSVRDLVRRGGLADVCRSLARRAMDVEDRVLRSQAVFSGRTRFDRAYLHAVNPHAEYYHCDRVLRTPFRSAVRHREQVLKHSIFTCASEYPLKGLQCLFRAAGLLKREFPNITVRMPGASFSNSLLSKGYSRYLHGLIRSLGLEEHVVTLGELGAEGMAEELARAHVFAFPSFADNSPNTLAEAMLVGVAIVASFSGGVPSMVRDEETALCFDAGDEVVLAECIRMMFADDDLATKLARNAREVALQRHDPKRIANRMLEIYQAALASGGARSEANLTG